MLPVVSAPVSTSVVRPPLAWWHLLSLDAPCVAVVWTAFLAYQFGVVLPLQVPISLGVAVWYLYVGDRISDAAQGRASAERHVFHRQHQQLFGQVALVLAPLMLLLMLRLPPAIRSGWLLLSLPLLAYVLAVHLLKLRVMKEPLVASFFAASVGLPTLLEANHSTHLAAWALVAFGCTCWLNCIAVARWEHSLQAADRVTAWLGTRFRLAAMLTICTIGPLLTNAKTAPVALAIATSAICLLLLDLLRDHYEATTLRALADACLLTPVAVWPLARLLTTR